LRRYPNSITKFKLIFHKESANATGLSKQFGHEMIPEEFRNSPDSSKLEGLRTFPLKILLPR